MPIKMDKILCAVDFSASSDHALEYARAFAKAHGSRLALLHVVEMPSLASFPTLFDREAPDQYDEYGVPRLRSSVVDMDAIRKAGREKLDELIETCAGESDDIEGEIVIGNPAIEVIKKAGEGEFDLVVLGTHGMTGLKHLLIGSVAEKVVRKAPCPVLTVRVAQS